jgi:hypothetical protein
MSSFSRRFLSATVAACFAGCGGSQPPIGTQAAMPQSRALATTGNRGASWMLPGAKSEDLLYVVDTRRVLVYSYPQSSLVGTLHLYDPSGDCADKAGNVWILDEYKNEVAFELAHGGTRPLRKLHVPGQRRAIQPQACSVDPTTGNLAVTSVADGVLVFPNATGSPKIYTARWYGARNCVYDENGNLYVDGEVGTASYSRNGLWELPKYGDRLLRLYDRHLTSERKFGIAAGIQWDGDHIAIANQLGTPIDRLVQHGRTVKTAQTVTLRESGTTVYQFWIQGNVLIEPYWVSARSMSGGIAFFNYPAGGSPFNTITGLDEPYSATVSTAK